VGDFSYLWKEYVNTLRCGGSSCIH